MSIYAIFRLIWILTLLYQTNIYTKKTIIMNHYSSIQLKNRILGMLVFCIISSLAFAQDENPTASLLSNPNHGIELGYNHELLSLADYSVYLGYNRSHPITEYIHLDMQVGVSHAKYTAYSSFFTRRSSNNWTASSYVGFKTYFMPAKYDFRLYGTIMAGGHLQIINYDSVERPNTVSPILDLSIGLMGEYKHVYGGIVSERGLNYLIAKLGYRF